MEVAERGLTKLSYKHLFLTSRNKMSVKQAVETCSSDVADDMMLHSKFGFKEILMTRMYLRKVAKYFRIMISTCLDQDAIHHLLQVLIFFKRWNNNIEETMKNRTSTLKEHWKQFISKHTYKDLIKVNTWIHRTGLLRPAQSFKCSYSSLQNKSGWRWKLF